jgi:hypothetical protein
MTHAGRLRCVLLISLSATRPIVMLSMAFPGRVAVLPAITIVAAIGVRIARPQVLTICIRVKLRAIAGVFDNLLRQCGSCGSCRNNSGGTNQRVFHLGLLVGFPRPEDGNTHPFRQSTFCMAVLKFNLMAPAERQTYIALTFDGMGRSQLHRSSRSRKIKSNLEDRRVTSRQSSVAQARRCHVAHQGSEINED